MLSQDLLSLPTLIIEHIFKKTPVFDLVNFSLSSDFANEAVNQFNYRNTPQIEVTLKPQNTLDFYIEISVLDGSGVWRIEKKDRKRPRNMERIGDDFVVIQKSVSSENLTIITTDILRTTSSLIHQIEKIYKEIDLTITFSDMMLSEISGISSWKLVSEAKRIKMIDSDLDSFSDFQKLLTANQELVLDGGAVEFGQELTVKTIEVKGSRLDYNMLNCENLILNEWIYTEDEALDYIGKWKNGGLDRLKTFKLLNADHQWISFEFEGIPWTQGPRFYETDQGLIDYSEGVDWIREDGRVVTLVFTMEGVKVDPMETPRSMRRTALFLVWP
uniref:F-box domain-containing protein n=1 Tax=Caenorhabditis tropicalis TaxID=1561998 RepID=A0A1I7UVE5_9PELO